MKIKTLAMLLLILATSNSMAERTVPYEFWKNDDGHCFFFVTKKSLWSGKIGGFNAYEGSLDAKYCERMFPKNPKSAFSFNMDIPADLLSVSVKSLEELSFNDTLSASVYHNGFHNQSVQSKIDLKLTRKDVYQLTENMDWESLSELNYTAKTLWTKLVNKYGSEKARSNFYTFKFSKDEKKEIKQFSKSVQLFIESTQIDNTWGLNVIGEIHPLLTQIILNLFTDQFHYQTQEGGFKFYNVIFNNFTNQLAMDNGQKFNKFFLESDSGRRFLDDKGNFVSFLSDEELLSFNKIPSGELKKNRVYINILNLLQLLSDKNCEQWGLWPGITRVVLNNMSFFSQGNDRYIHTTVMTNIFQKSQNACGPITIDYLRASVSSSDLDLYRTSKIYNVKTKESRKLSVLFQKMAKKWFK